MFKAQSSNGSAVVNGINIGLSPLIRKEILHLLNGRLADSIDLMLQAKQAHWTARGSNFLPLHELFDKVAEEAASFADLLAERTMQLGGSAEGTVQVVAGISQLDAYPVDISESQDHLDRTYAAAAKYARLIHKAIDECADRRDPVTTDIFTEIGRKTEKFLWLIQAHKSSRWRFAQQEI